MPRSLHLRLAALLLACAAAGCQERHTLLVTAFLTDARGTTGRRVAEGGNLADPHGIAMFVGATAAPCHLVVLSVNRQFLVTRLDAPGAALPCPVEVGPFRLPGGRVFDPGPGLLRVFAFCGGADLRYDMLASAVESQARLSVAEDSTDGALRRLDRIEGLPPGVEQATALYRLRP